MTHRYHGTDKSVPYELDAMHSSIRGLAKGLAKAPYKYPCRFFRQGLCNYASLFPSIVTFWLLYTSTVFEPLSWMLQSVKVTLVQPHRDAAAYSQW